MTKDAHRLSETTAGRFTAGATIVAFLEVLLLGVWLGSMIFFSFVVAPRSFSILPTRHLAGQLVSSILSSLEMMGLILGPLLIVLRLISGGGISRFIKLLHPLLLALMTASAALSRIVIAPKLELLRAAMGGVIDNVPPDDPLRIQFDHLHQYSVALMTAAMLSGLIAMLLTVRSWLKR